MHGKGETAIRGYSTDSRTIRQGELYFALKGARFDGHDFLGEVLNVASGAVVSVPPVAPPSGKWVIHVNDTLVALQSLARHMRNRLGVKVVGITGSNGKTTAKEMTAAVLSSALKVHKNAGNLNNQIGLPQSLLKLERADEVSVLEMGASHKGDIRQLCEIALPNIGVITNIGQAHLEGFGGLAGVRGGKLELLEFVSTAILNADDKYMLQGAMAYKGRVIRYGIDGGEVTARDIDLSGSGASFTLVMAGGEARVNLGVTGRFNVLNALAASAVGLAFGLDAQKVSLALEGFRAVPMRFERREHQGAVLLVDVYNANPGSMREALAELVRLKGARAVAVLGDMLELGSTSDDMHAELGRWMGELKAIDCLIAVGPGMQHAARAFGGGRVLSASNATEARGLLKDEIKAGDTVLIKGSRGMAMEGAIPDAV